MNEILTLKGKFEQKSGHKPGPIKLPKKSGVRVSSTKIRDLIRDLEVVQQFWRKQKNIISKMLVSAHYRQNIAKSNRIKGFFGSNTDKLIVGSKFDPAQKHIITYLISDSQIKNAISDGEKAAKILDQYFNGTISDTQFNRQNALKGIDFKQFLIAKTKFQKLVVDAWYVDKFDVEKADFSAINNSIVSFYQTDEDLSHVLAKIGIKTYQTNFLDDRTILMDTDSVNLLMEKAPYLVSMATEDLTQLSPPAVASLTDNRQRIIPAPNGEPVIGVIDTLFDERVYFNEWVHYQNMLDPNISTASEDYDHGTAVSSIIVDGPALNPLFDDGCGRFRVKHFGVSLEKGFSSFAIIKSIKEAVATNPEIHVWNLSLGSNAEINQNFISAEGAALDEIQFKNNVLFVIAGTNKKPSEPLKKIGAPADSINSVVVNSVDNEHNPEPYSRKGIVLSFFTKPDLSYYGGDEKKPLKAYGPKGQMIVSGTSFSAPWIARKLAYLIDVLGLSREIAKALLIDSAIGWRRKNETNGALELIGNGIVPVRIEDIVNCPDNEIKFTLEGVSEKWSTYNYQIPVPVVDHKYPFLAKATLCYFPKCSRNQGVDYTNTELDLHFGRLKSVNGKPSIDSINKNKQNVGYPLINEAEARDHFRKWDNVKTVSDFISDHARPRITYGEDPIWGIMLNSKERLSNKDGRGLKFGIVVTLKEINNINRIDDFIQQASFHGWLVNKIDVQNRIDVYEQGNQNLKLE